MTTRLIATSATRRRAATGAGARLLGAVLCLAVAAIHIIDQGGIPGTKTPGYVGILYWLLEIVGVLVAVLLLRRVTRAGWFLALGVAAGPLAGYLLSRGPGLPYYTDDKGNWTEPLGLVSLAVEGLLLIVAAVMFRREARARLATEDAPAAEADLDRRAA
jgi:hypothetical protein